MATVLRRTDEEDSLMVSVRVPLPVDAEQNTPDPSLARMGKKAISKKAESPDEMVYQDLIRRTESKRFGKYPLLQIQTDTQMHRYDPYTSPPIISQAEIHAVGVQLTQKANRVGKSGDSDFKERCMCCGLSTVCSLTDF